MTLAQRCAVSATAALALVAVAGPAAGAEGEAPRPRVEVAPTGDDHPSLLEQRRRDARDAAVHGFLDGSVELAPGDSVVALPGRAQPLSPTAPPTTPYADIETTGADRVLTVLVDFGPGDYAGRTWNGPVHGRSATEGVGHFENLLFGPEPSLRDYLAEQSSGRYAVSGAVHGPVGVPYNAAYYGADQCNDDCPDRVADFVADAMDAFVADFYARNPAGDLAAYLAPFDRRDRYDADRDGGFDEPDGYVDHVVLVFAGEAQEDSGDADALRSRFGSISAGDVDRLEPLVTANPPGSGAEVAAVGTPTGSGPLGGIRGGHPLGGSGLWADTFVAVPEDVGLAELVHLYGHDLGLPDLADPSRSVTVDANVGFWSPMAAGARLGGAGPTGDEPLGSAPVDLLAAERLLLGWLDTDVLPPAVDRTIELDDNAAVVPLGDLGGTVMLTGPDRGARAFVSTLGASADAVLQRPLRGDEGRVTWRQWTDIEPVFDTVRVQTLTGSEWRDIAPVRTGRSDWTSRSAPIPDGATMLRFVYSTDLVTTGGGVVLDDIAVGAEPAEGGEDGLPTGWTAIGWAVGDGTVTTTGPGVYLAERRSYGEYYDAALESAPHVADPRAGTTAVDRFGYADGVLVTFWDGRAADNVVSAHPASGRLLVVDARPEAVQTIVGKDAPLGLGPFDAAFGTTWTRGFTVDAYALSPGGTITADRVRMRAQPPAPVFDDTDPRYATGSPGQPRLPGVGVHMTVVAENEAVTTVRFGRAPIAATPPTS